MYHLCFNPIFQSVLERNMTFPFRFPTRYLSCIIYLFMYVITIWAYQRGFQMSNRTYRVHDGQRIDRFSGEKVKTVNDIHLPYS